MNPKTLINIDPDLKSNLDDLRRDIFLNLKCHDIATIKSVNAAKQTLTAEINYKRFMLRPNTTKTNTKNRERFEYIQKEESYPVLIDVPFIVLRGGNSYLNVPIQAGDQCLLLYNDRAFDDWFIAGKQAPLSSNRAHSMADAIALVGLSSSKNAIGGYDAAKLGLVKGTTKVMLGEKIKVENSAQNLNTVLQELITKIKDLAQLTAAITVTSTAPGSPTGIPLNAAAITAKITELTATGNKLGGLLE